MLGCFGGSLSKHDQHVGLQGAWLLQWHKGSRTTQHHLPGLATKEDQVGLEGTVRQPADTHWQEQATAYGSLLCPVRQQRTQAAVGAQVLYLQQCLHKGQQQACQVRVSLPLQHRQVVVPS